MTPDLNDPELLLARTLAAAGGAAWARVRTLHARGSVRAGGLAGPCEQWIDLEGARFAQRLSLGPAVISSGHDGVQAWQHSANGEVVVQDSEACRRAAATDAWINARGWWFATRHAAAVESLGRREADGAAFDVLRCVPAGGSRARLPIEIHNHHVFVAVELDGHPLRFMLDTGGVNLVASATARRMAPRAWARSRRAGPARNRWPAASPAPIAS